ncbi:MAG: hypothetical protein RR333_02910 [Bacteroidales bacterium]
MQNNLQKNGDYTDTTVSNSKGKKKPMSFLYWFITLFLTIIPLVGLIFLAYWAFGDNYTFPERNTFAKAALLWLIFLIFIVFFAWITFGENMFFSR